MSMYMKVYKVMIQIHLIFIHLKYMTSLNLFCNSYIFFLFYLNILIKIDYFFNEKILL